MGEITNTRASLPATEANRDFSILLAVLSNRLEPGPKGSHVISDRQLPTDAERGQLVTRKSQLAASLMPGDRIGMARSVATMFAAFPSVRLDEAAAKRTTAVYVSTIDKFPNWVVDAACRAVVNRAEPFPPSAGELRAACLAASIEATTEKASIENILTATPYAALEDDERKRVGERFAVLRDDLAKSSEPPKGRPRVPAADLRAAEEINAGRRDPRPLPALSPTLRAKMGLPDRDGSASE